MKNTIRVSFRLPADVAQLLAEEAVRSRRTKTAVLVIAIEDYVAQTGHDCAPKTTLKKVLSRVEKPVDTQRKR